MSGEETYVSLELKGQSGVEPAIYHQCTLFSGNHANVVQTVMSMQQGKRHSFITDLALSYKNNANANNMINAADRVFFNNDYISYLTLRRKMLILVNFPYKFIERQNCKIDKYKPISPINTVNTLMGLVVQLSNGIFLLKRVSRYGRCFMIDSGSKGCPEQESAGCHFGTLGRNFLRAKTKWPPNM